MVLASNDLGEINYVQSCAGVHITLDLKLDRDDSLQIRRNVEYPVVDFRFKTALNANHKESLIFDSFLSLNVQEDQELLSVSVCDDTNGNSMIISIISTNSSDIGWTWGVNCLLVLLDRDEDSLMRFNPSEKNTLNNGGVLAHTDNSTMKTILQVKPYASLKGINVIFLYSDKIIYF
jgi:hypothetical protein